MTNGNKIALRAARRGGVLLAELEKGGREGGDRKSKDFRLTHVGKSDSPYRDVLNEAGVSYKQAAQVAVTRRVDSVGNTREISFANQACGRILGI
jgi:hypothetical protein